MATGAGGAEALLVGAMWWYATTVLQPARALKRSGLAPSGAVVGTLPVGSEGGGLGPLFSRRHPEPVLLGRETKHDHLVQEFDRMAEIYQVYVQPFSGPIFEEGLEAMTPYLQPDSRVMDAGCGPGRELQRVARLLPMGEVVGVDLAPGMVITAHESARAHGLDNCAFFQADVGDLSKAFRGRFDLVYSCLAHHHYPDPEAATASVLGCLRPGGVYCVIDPGPAWFNAMSAPLSRLADPGWVGFHTPDEFCELFLGTGFTRAAWLELLPGFGLAVGQAPT